MTTDFSLFFFNRAFFLQCSPIALMQSPYVLKSHVVDNTKILHTKPLSFNKQQKKQAKTLQKRHTDVQIQGWQSLLMHILAFNL